MAKNKKRKAKEAITELCENFPESDAANFYMDLNADSACRMTYLFLHNGIIATVFFSQIEKIQNNLEAVNDNSYLVNTACFLVRFGDSICLDLCSMIAGVTKNKKLLSALKELMESSAVNMQQAYDIAATLSEADFISNADNLKMAGKTKHKFLHTKIAYYATSNALKRVS